MLPLDVPYQQFINARRVSSSRQCVDGDAMTRQDWLLALRTFIVVYLII